jgi:hypothetical protein
MGRPVRWWVFVVLGQLLLAVLFAVSARIPVGGGQSQTTLGYPPGSKDPNTHYDIRVYGFPVPWLEVTRTTVEAEGIDRTRYTITSPLVPLAAVIITICLPLGLGSLALPARPGRAWGKWCLILSGGGVGVLAVVASLAWWQATGSGPRVSGGLTLGTERLRFAPLLTGASVVGFLVGGVWVRTRFARPRLVAVPAPLSS